MVKDGEFFFAFDRIYASSFAVYISVVVECAWCFFSPNVSAYTVYIDI